jgi:hypothetical protein
VVLPDYSYVQTKFTPLMAAALCGHVGVVKQLLDSGADATATNKRGKTALDLARACKFEGETTARQTAMRSFLLHTGTTGFKVSKLSALLSY